MSIEVLVEAGGNANGRARCRQAFASFFGKLALQNGRPRVTACGGRDDTIQEFATASDTCVLLIDSEGPPEDAWNKIASSRLPKVKRDAKDRHFLMVQ